MSLSRIIHTGLVHNMPNDKYHALTDVVSNSMLSAMRKSPQHCYKLHLDPKRPPPPEPSDAFRNGTLTHCAVLEPHALTDRYVVRPIDPDTGKAMDFRTKVGKAWRDAQTREITDADMLMAAMAQCFAVHDIPDLKRILGSGEAETSVFWTDERTGLACRCRPDWLHFLDDGRVICFDLKTTSDASPAEFSRSVWTYGYHCQQAHYTAGLRAIGLEVAGFIFGAVTNAYPFIAVGYQLDEEAEARGEAEVRELLNLFAQCKHADSWPAYGTNIQILSLPAWSRAPIIATLESETA